MDCFTTCPLLQLMYTPGTQHVLLVSSGQRRVLRVRLLFRILDCIASIDSDVGQTLNPLSFEYCLCCHHHKSRCSCCSAVQCVCKGYFCGWCTANCGTSTDIRHAAVPTPAQQCATCVDVRSGKIGERVLRTSMDFCCLGLHLPHRQKVQNAASVNFRRLFFVVFHRLSVVISAIL